MSTTAPSTLESSSIIYDAINSDYVRIAIITGAGSGIGRAVAQRIVQENYWYHGRDHDQQQEHYMNSTSSSSHNRNNNDLHLKKKWIVILVGRTLRKLQETQLLCANYSIAKDASNSNGSTVSSTMIDNDSSTSICANDYRRTTTMTAINDCICIPTDVTIEEQVIDLFKAISTILDNQRLIATEFVLFNNAGINSIPKSIEHVSLTDFQLVLNTNVIGPFLCSREAIKMIQSYATIHDDFNNTNNIENHKSQPYELRIINNGSISSHVPRPYSTTYTTSKYALSGLTRCIALDTRMINTTNNNIQIACGQVDFGNIATELSASIRNHQNSNDDDGDATTVGTLLQSNGTYIVEPTMNVMDAAETVYCMMNLPITTNILQMTVLPTNMPSYIGRG